MTYFRKIGVSREQLQGLGLASFSPSLKVREGEKQPREQVKR